jgi:hypothetical protein
MDIRLTSTARPIRFAPNFFPLNRLFGGGGPVEPQMQAQNQAQNQQQHPRNIVVHLQALPDRPNVNPRDADDPIRRLADFQRAHRQRQIAQARDRIVQVARPDFQRQLGAQDERARARDDLDGMRARIEELEQMRDAVRRA